jgi:hypothetical protein
MRWRKLMLHRGKSINLFLIDGDPRGHIKCTLANWTGLAHRIPRNGLDKCAERRDLSQSGVYCFFGKIVEGFVVLAGSILSKNVTESCPEHVKILRNKYGNKINENRELMEDLLFSSPSAAASFIAGSNRNGNDSWKLTDGRTLILRSDKV